MNKKDIPCINCITLPICKVKVFKLMKMIIDENREEYEDVFGICNNFDNIIPFDHDINWVIESHAGYTCSMINEHLKIIKKRKHNHKGVYDIEVIKMQFNYIKNIYDYIDGGNEYFNYHGR